MNNPADPFFHEAKKWREELAALRTMLLDSGLERLNLRPHQKNAAMRRITQATPMKHRP